jgi:Protein of unknown function (DUF3667)
MPKAAAPALVNCPNCGHALAQPQPKFCSACGQETRVQAPTLREFAQQFGGAYLATEGALWRTLKLLLFKPGELTRQYLAGRRKHYVLPLRLYLTVSVLVLLCVRLFGVPGMNVEVPDLSSPKAKPHNLSVMQFGEHTGFGLRNGVFYCDNLPAWLCQRARRRLDIDPKGVAAAIDQFKDRFLGNLGAAMFVLLPSFALWLKLAYLNRRWRYTEHLVFALHLHAFWFVALAAGVAGNENVWLASAAGLAVPIYALWAMRRVYGGRWWLLLPRAGAISFLHLVTLAFALAFVGLWSLLA